MKAILLLVITFSLLITASYANEQKSKAERGSQFYEFSDVNSSNQKTKNSERTNSKSSKDISSILSELLKVAKEQRDIQKDIYNLLSEEFHPTPKTVIINGKKCIANSSKDCFVMPLTKDAQKIPVLKKMLLDPTPESAKNWLQWYGKYMTTGPLAVGQNFEYAMNTYGEKAFPMNLSRPEINTNTNALDSKRAITRMKILNKLYDNGTLGMYIFLSNRALDYFTIPQLKDIINGIKNKKGLTLLFKTEKERKDFTSVIGKKVLKNIPIVVNSKYFAQNNIYMTPTYLAVSKHKGKIKKQAVSVGRVSAKRLNTKTYIWLEENKIVKKGSLSDYKIWNSK